MMSQAFISEQPALFSFAQVTALSSRSIYSILWYCNSYRTDPIDMINEFMLVSGLDSIRSEDFIQRIICKRYVCQPLPIS